jgi:hypothetical protein
MRISTLVGSGRSAESRLEIVASLASWILRAWVEARVWAVAQSNAGGGCDGEVGPQGVKVWGVMVVRQWHLSKGRVE